MDEGCLFCKIASGQVSSYKIYEDETTLAFRDINPQAPIHILIIPKKHINGLDSVSDEDEQVLGHIQLIAKKIAKQFPELKDGFRLVSNCGKGAGQTVFHIHYHLLGGRVLSLSLG